MNQLVLFLAVVASLASLGSATKSDYELLDDQLFHSYNRHVFPAAKASDQVPVMFGLIAANLDLDQNGRMKALFWLNVNYTDSRLAYDSSEFGGIKSVKVDPARIWTPDVVLYNSLTGNQPLPARFENGQRANALIYPSGSVLYVPTVAEDVQCKNNDNKDEYECAFTYGSWTFDGDMMDLDFGGEAKITMELQGDTTDLKIVSNEAKRVVKHYPGFSEPYISLNYKLTVQRVHPNMI